MKEQKGRTFRIIDGNQPVPGCTISYCVQEGDNCITYFSLAEHTDISAELYSCHKLLIVAAGELEVYIPAGETRVLREGDALVTPAEIPVGMGSKVSAVYTEISIQRSDIMNQNIKIGEAFQLAELVPYQAGRIVNMDVVHNEKMKFVIMAFDAGTGLTEHAAPGEAMIFALDGEGIIGYEGKEHIIKAGENFVFAKGGRHWVKAEKNFKMALLLTLE